jgi:transcriptional regulator with XRE-family HTH domain
MGEEGVLNINQRVKFLRKELKLTQRGFATAITVSPSLITCIEKGTRVVNDRLIRLICDSFDVNPQWLKTGAGGRYNSEKGARVTKLLALFGNLKPRYQEFVLNQVDQFLKMQEEEGP